MQTIYSLQILRYIAALSIVLFHIPYFRGFTIGVDIFFVLSGFVISYVANINKNHFFLKRLIRIIPLYWSLTIFIFIFKLIYPEIFSSHQNVYELFKSLFFIPIFSEDLSKILYPVVMVGWTLNYEILFYLLFSFSILISNKYYEYICILLISIIVLVPNFIKTENIILIYLSNSIMIEFIYGIIIFKLYKNLSYFNHYYYPIISFLLILITLQIPFQNIRCIDLGLTSLCIVIFVLSVEKYIPKLEIFNKIGLLSYAMYLVHSYPISFIGLINTFYNFEQLTLYVIFIAYIIIISVLSYYIYAFFEKIIINKTKNKLINV